MVELISDMPIIILGFISAIITVLLTLGYIYRTTFPMSTFWFLSGAIFLIIFLTINTISIGYTEERSILTDSVHFPAVEDNQLAHYNVSIGNADLVMRASSNNLGGERTTASSSLIGDTIDTVTVNLRKNGSPTGTYYVAVWDRAINPTNANMLHTFGTGNSALLTTSYQALSFTGDSYTITTDDVIGVFYSGGSAGNEVWIRYQSTPSSFDGTNTIFSFWNTGGLWSDVSAGDLTAVFIQNVEGSDEITVNSYDTVGNSPITYDIKVIDENGLYTAEPTFIGIMLIILALSFIMIGILIERFN